MLEPLTLNMEISDETMGERCNVNILCFDLCILEFKLQQVVKAYLALASEHPEDLPLLQDVFLIILIAPTLNNFLPRHFSLRLTLQGCALCPQHQLSLHMMSSVILTQRCENVTFIVVQSLKTHNDNHNIGRWYCNSTCASIDFSWWQVDKSAQAIGRANADIHMWIVGWSLAFSRKGLTPTVRRTNRTSQYAIIAIEPGA